MGSLNSNWARFSLHWQKQNLRSASPTHTHQTVLLRLGPGASTLPRAAPLPTFISNPNPPHSSQAAFCLSLSLPPSLFLLLSVTITVSVSLCFRLCVSVSLSPTLVSAIPDLPNPAARSWQDWAGQWAIPWTPKLTGPSSAAAIGLSFQKLLRPASAPILPPSLFHLPSGNPSSLSSEAVP